MMTSIERSFLGSFQKTRSSMIGVPYTHLIHDLGIFCFSIHLYTQAWYTSPQGLEDFIILLALHQGGL